MTLDLGDLSGDNGIDGFFLCQSQVPIWRAGVAGIGHAFRSHSADLIKAYIPQTTQAGVSRGVEANTGLLCFF